MTRKPIGFTLTELLVVVAIIAFLVAILLPVFSHIRKDARRSASASNLHQCWTALQMYCDDYDASPRSMPTWEVAKLVLKDVPTCDSSDTWRTSCAEQFGSPLVGSYGYARTDEVLDPDHLLDPIYAQYGLSPWDVYIGYDNPPLMVSIFYADVVPDRFYGAFHKTLPVVEPNRLLSVYMDGSVRVYQRSFPYPINMDWNLVFTSQTATLQKLGGNNDGIGKDRRCHKVSHSISKV